MVPWTIKVTPRASYQLSYPQSHSTTGPPTMCALAPGARARLTLAHPTADARRAAPLHAGRMTMRSSTSA